MPKSACTTFPAVSNCRWPAATFLENDRFDALVALGAVIRGQTPHFEFVAGECAKGIMDVQLATGTPIGFGVLTTESFEQAEERADPKRGNLSDQKIGGPGVHPRACISAVPGRGSDAKANRDGEVTVRCG